MVISMVAERNEHEYDRGGALAYLAAYHVYQLLFGTREAAEATEQIGKFLRARVR
jgi:hypothetical protein